MTLEEQTRRDLVEALKVRGTQSRIADALGVAPTTVMRWKEGEGIPPPMVKLLRLYLFGEIPFDSVRTPDSPSLESVLDFTEDEYRIIGILARRAGMEPRQWIAVQVRAILSFYDSRSRLAVDSPPANVTRHPSAADNILAFPEIPLFHAAAGLPVAADGDIYAPTRKLGPGRIACQLHGESMAPRFPDGSTVILRARDSLRNPQLKKGEIYLFDRAGEKTLKVYNTRKATAAEIKAGLSYPSADGTPKVRVLRSLNPAFPEIVATEPIHWLGWLDKDDNP